jgi:putative nucleotidyltransferase with HDIG domain
MYTFPKNIQRRPIRENHQLITRIQGLFWLIILWLLLVFVVLVDTSPQQGLDVGMVSTQNIRTQGRLTYHSEVRTQRTRDRAATSVEPIFSPPDRSQAVRQTASAHAITRYLLAVRADPYADQKRKMAYIGALQPLQFETQVAEKILLLSDDNWQEVVDETVRVLDNQMRREITENRLPSVLRNLPNQISTSLSDEQALIATAWAGGLITPNSFLDSERSEQARQAAREAVVPIEWTYEAGQIVVREGEIVSAEQVEALKQLGLHQPARSFNNIVGTLLFLLLLVLFLGFYLERLYPIYYASHRVMALLVIFLVGITIGIRLVMAEHILLSYLLPTSVVSMLLGVLLSVDLAIVATVFISLLVGYLTNSIELISYTFISGLMAALLLCRVEQLSAFVRSGVVVGLTNIALVLVFTLQDSFPRWVHIGMASGVGLLNGIASASLALVGFYALSSMLGITTFLQLMELARPTHPLFRELMLKAPGTYHHSIVVSNLAEGAAEAIGADMLLVRIGAYYHDIGKTINPQYFVENQTDGINLHDQLDEPYKSAEIILSHVTEGLALAKRHKLPPELIDFIGQHHGTTLVAWFYHKACKQDGAENVDQASFRYIGPKPQTREAAVMMLADTVEATARAVKPAGAEEIDALIRKTIANKLADGQLDESDLNLRDLDRIRKAFLKVLQGIYHPRISYPDGKTSSPKKLSSPSTPPQNALNPPKAAPAPSFNNSTTSKG